jgi:hypothetical protein
MFRKFTSLSVIAFFLSTLLTPVAQVQAQALLGLPEPGTMVSVSPAYDPAMIKGLVVHKDNPFIFDFIVDVGQDHLTGERLKRESSKLIKYFLAGLTIPEKDLWVNLSPYEKDRTIPEALGQTDMGRDLLAQDYILKQITASLIYPDRQLGKTFWSEVYTKAQQLYGTTQVPVNTFNKVWITADRAKVFERNNTAFVVDCHLKVMLEEDYLALKNHTAADAGEHSLASNIVREIILPQLEREVNQGRNFFQVRQIFNSIILASWYKNNLKQALLNQVYADHGTVKGIDLLDKTIKERIYRRYLQAYKKGVFNFIKEDAGPVQGVTIPRKYFSGGMDAGMAAHPQVTEDRAMLDNAMSNTGGELEKITAQLQQEPLDIPGYNYKGGIPLDEAKHFLGAVMTTSALVDGEQVVRYSEIWDPLLSPERVKFSKEQIRSQPGMQAVYLKGSIIRQKAGQKIILTADMGDIPKWLLGKEIFLGATCSEILKGAKSASLRDLKQSPQVVVRAGGYFRIISQDDKSGEDMYLLTLNYERIQQVGELKLTPPGGTSRFTEYRDKNGKIISGKRIYEAAGLGTLPEVKVSPLDVADPYAVRVELSGKNLDRFLEMFEQGQGRERFFPIREFYEELVGPSTLLRSRFQGIGSIRGSILDPDRKDGIWAAVSPTRIRLKYILKQMLAQDPTLEETVQKIAGKDTSKVLVLLRQAFKLSEVGLLPSYPDFYKEEFKGTMTPEALVEGLKASGIDVPAADAPIDSLNLILENENLWGAMKTLLGNFPKEALPYISRLEKGERFNLFETEKLNRMLIAALCPEATPERRGYFTFNGWPYRTLGDMVKATSTTSGGDAASLSQDRTKGGIDLNTENMTWDISKDGNGVEMTVDPALIERIRHIGIESLTPVIFRITPVVSVWPLLGLQDPQ